MPLIGILVRGGALLGRGLLVGARKVGPTAIAGAAGYATGRVDARTREAAEERAIERSRTHILKEARREGQLTAREEQLSTVKASAGLIGAFAVIGVALIIALGIFLRRPARG